MNSDYTAAYLGRFVSAGLLLAATLLFGVLAVPTLMWVAVIIERGLFTWMTAVYIGAVHVLSLFLYVQRRRLSSPQLWARLLAATYLLAGAGGIVIVSARVLFPFTHRTSALLLNDEPLLLVVAQVGLWVLYLAVAWVIYDSYLSSRKARADLPIQCR